MTEVHGTRRLLKVSEVILQKLGRITRFPGPVSLSDQLLIETTMVYLRQVLLQGRAIHCSSRTSGLQRSPMRI